MDNFRVGVVITVGPGRRENVELMLDRLSKLEGDVPEQVVLVLDGPDVDRVLWPEWWHGRINAVRPARKHQPGMEQPRNMGVRALRPGLTHAWFLDSDILVAPDTLSAYHDAARIAEDAILIGPYEWLPFDRREPVPELQNDWRWEMFRDEALEPKIAKLNVALGCFGGNLVWPIDAFRRVGGFHPQLHHGRCEDGELGLRAASHRIPMVLVPGARGWHLAHDVDTPEAVRRNQRDVPLLNSWHPWVQVKCKACDALWEGGCDHCVQCGATESTGGLIVTDEDGARFDFVCTCGEQVNTLLMWEHFARAHGGRAQEPELILPEGL